MLAFLKLIRAKNLLIIAFTQLMTYFFLVERNHFNSIHFPDNQLFILILSTLCIAAAGYIINDYFDVKIDLVNKPSDVIVGKQMKRRWAMMTHQGLNVLGVLLGAFLGWKVLIINILSVSALWFYSERFKRQAFIGNFLVAVLTALSVWILAVYFQKNTLLIGIYSLFAFATTLIREIIKDMEDMKGDARYQCKTLPIIWGIRRTKTLLYLLTFILAITLIFMSVILNNQTLLFVFIIALAPMSWFVMKLYRADKVSHFAYLTRVCKLFMIAGILTMIIV